MRMARVYAVALCILMTVSLCCCGVKGQMSDKYLVGYNFGENGISPGKTAMEVRICYDGTVDVLIMSVNGNDITYEVVGSYKLTDDEINRLSATINQNKLYRLNPKENGSVCDGKDKYLYLYDKDDLVLKQCGGYMPSNEEFLEMYNNVKDVLRYEEQTQMYKEWIDARTIVE